MKVFIVTEHNLFDYNVGVFSSLKKAKEHATKNLANCQCFKIFESALDAGKPEKLCTIYSRRSLYDGPKEQWIVAEQSLI